MEKLIVTRIYTFSIVLFTMSSFSVELEIVVCRSLSLEESKICCLGKIREHLGTRRKAVYHIVFKSSVGTRQDLRTGGHRFDPQVGQ